MGHVIKITILFQESFWKKNGFNGFFFSDNGPIRLGYDLSNKADGLLGFVCGNKAKEFGEKSIKERKALVIKQISRLFKVSEKHVSDLCTGYIDYNWAEVK
jgi:monoamine oxidase